VSTVFEQARSLVKAMREGDEWRQMRRLAGKVKADRRLEAMLADFREAQFEAQVAQLQASRLEPELSEQLAKLGKAIERETLLHQYLMAEAAYGQVLMEVQQVLAETFHPEVPGAVKSSKHDH
jgi:cell fate (sporulation/competence/biofilm development) regulator YlbF (YheA/YmcA/DUF963 family)